MARARNIKPGFFTDDELADNDPITRLLFIGLWTIADFKGCLEWREKRIKAQLLPYDKCDLKKLAINLDKSGFIRFYSDGEKTYIKVVNFEIHQNPHKNEKEKGSHIPDYTEDMRQLVDLKGVTINRDKNGTNQDKNETNPADSLLLIPDSFNQREAQKTRFEEWYSLYPLKKSKQEAEKSWIKQKLDDRADELIGILKNQIENDAQWNDGVGIPHPSTYLNQKRWTDEIVKINKKQQKQEWAIIPRLDEALWEWAKKHGYQGPGTLTYAQYRQVLTRKVDERIRKETPEAV